MRRVVMFSGGVGSWGAARRVAEAFGVADLTLLFCDTLIEDPDLYRFLEDAAVDVGVPVTRIADGRTPWEVFRDVRYLGNTRADPCSRILKRSLSDAWLAEHCDPAATVVYVGLDWTEEHRFGPLRERRRAEGWRYEAPLCAPPYLTKPELLGVLAGRGIRAPRLYSLGFHHNNCGGGCVKAGVAHFAHLYRALPAVFAEWERRELELREQLGDVSILRDRRGGHTRPMPLAELRQRIEAREQLELTEWGGCGCFVDDGGAR